MIVRTEWRSIVVVALLVAGYLAISLPALDVVPPVYEDEPWQASVGAKLASEGVLGSDVFSGFHGMDRRYYAFMPVHPMLLAATFRLGGVGLLQARLESVTLGALTLILTYALARRLFGHGIGVLAVTFLLLVRLTGASRYQISGILLLDVSRIARYDMAVPVFGLLSLHAFLTAAARANRGWYALAGLLAGVAMLSHVYGAFWFAALVLLAILFRAGVTAAVAVALGFAAPCLAYGAFIAGGVAEWQLQTREYGPRFDLLNPSWYLGNLIAERRRYGPGLGDLGWHYVARPSFWIMAVVVPASLAALARRAWRGDRAAAAIAVPALVFVSAFALLIQSKVANYLATLMPLLMIAAAWGTARAWQLARTASAGAGRTSRAVMACLLAVMVVEGAVRIAVLVGEAGRTTPYASFIAQVRPHVPAGSRVLGLHTYWFGMHDYDYVSWFVPVQRANARLFASAPSVERALDDVSPDVILIDDRMRAYLRSSSASDPVPAGALAWMQQQGFSLAAAVRDPTYGTMEIYVANRGGAESRR